MGNNIEHTQFSGLAGGREGRVLTLPEGSAYKTAHIEGHMASVSGVGSCVIQKLLLVSII